MAIFENGRKNPYNVAPITVQNADGTQDTFRLYYKGTAATLETAVALVKKYNANGKLTPCEYKQLVSMLWIVNHKDTDKQNSKLAGLSSLSTSCLCNKYCQFRMQDCNSICHHCYAGTQQTRQFGLADHNMINSIILKNVLIPAVAFSETFPLYNDRFFRIESFGDVENVTQALNYIRLMKSFPETTFAVWTKNYAIWLAAFDKEGKPENCVFIVSSNYCNVEMKTDSLLNAYADHVFTVYTEEYITAHNVQINCGGRKCMECIKAGKGCYFKGTEKQIREKLK